MTRTTTPPGPAAPRRLFLLLLGAAVFTPTMGPPAAAAATRTWDAGGGEADKNWSNPANWSDDAEPGPSDAAVTLTNAFAADASGAFFNWTGGRLRPKNYNLSLLNNAGTGVLDPRGVNSTGGEAGSRALLSGDYAQGPDATFHVDIFAAPPPFTPDLQHDSVGVTGAATLDGAFETQLAGDFVPDWLHRFAVMTWGSRTGTFDTCQTPGADASMAFVPVYDPDGLDLVYARRGDANLDGRVDLADLDGLRAGFLSLNDVDDWGTGDFDGNGSTTIADFGLLRLNFGTAAPGLVAGVTDADRAALADFGASVPEPSGVALLAATAAALALGRRRRHH